MRRNPKIRLNIKSNKELKKLAKCAKCESIIPWGDLHFYVDESNISITNNSKGICSKCKKDGH